MIMSVINALKDWETSVSWRIAAETADWAHHFVSYLNHPNSFVRIEGNAKPIERRPTIRQDRLYKNCQHKWIVVCQHISINHSEIELTNECVQIFRNVYNNKHRPNQTNRNAELARPSCIRRYIAYCRKL